MVHFRIRLLTVFLACLGTTSPTLAALADSQSLKSQIRTFAQRDNPSLPSNTEILINEYDVPNLLESLQAQLFLARFLSQDGQQFNELLFLYRDGKIKPVGATFGGWGLMSALMFGDELYYTYSFGSGIHRSHIGRVSIASGNISVMESQAFQGIDVFVKNERGRLVVEEGAYLGYNKWQFKRQLGALSELRFLQQYRQDSGLLP